MPGTLQVSKRKVGCRRAILTLSSATAAEHHETSGSDARPRVTRRRAPRTGSQSITTTGWIGTLAGIFGRQTVESVRQVRTDTASDRLRGAWPVLEGLRPYAFRKSDLHRLTVVNQVDNKFIACLLHASHEAKEPRTRDRSRHTDAPLLVLFDQHAVHERVRLERLTRLNVEAKDAAVRVTSVPCVPPFRMELDPVSANVVRLRAAKFARWGLDCSFDTDDGYVSLHSLPRCLAEREEEKLRRNGAHEPVDFIQDLLYDCSKWCCQAGGSSGTLPPPLQDILNGQACRGAIKFGDPLNTAECIYLLRKLKKCAMPFQCAHGRPTVVPLVDFGALNDNHRKQKPNLHRLKRIK